MLANKASLYIVDPDRKGAASSKPKDAKDNESQKAYYTRKCMEIMLPGRKKGHSGVTQSSSHPAKKLREWLVHINYNVLMPHFFS